MRKSLSVLVALSFAAFAATAAPTPTATHRAVDTVVQPPLTESNDALADTSPSAKAAPAAQDADRAQSDSARPQEQVAWRFLRRFFRV